jgi:hypothetical protein
VDLSHAKKDPSEVLVEKSKVRDDRHQGMGRFSVSSARLPTPITQPHATFAPSAISSLRTLKFEKFFPISPLLAVTS